MSQKSLKVKKLFEKIGPGIITGASDDDPSGIATYSIAGAQAGYSLLWTAILTFPLMAGVQEMCARIGMVTGKGLCGTMKTYYPKSLLILITTLFFIATSINIGADLSGMAEATKLLINLPSFFLAILFAVLIVSMMILFPYKTIAKNLKWLTFALFAYILSGLFTKQDWSSIIFHTFIPAISFDGKLTILLVAIFGTTISPYLFFWQASEEVEEELESGQIKKERRVQIVTKHELKGMREDVTLGMFFSNLVMFFIIATTASTLFRNGITNISTADQAAQALKPLAGDAAFVLFALGIIGTGLLAIPVLAGASAYAVSEVFGWQEGLSKKFQEAKAFYGVIIMATLVGILINFLKINPFTALFYTAVIYGLISPLLIVTILHIANNKKIMGAKTNGFFSNTLGGLTLAIMTFSAIAVFVFNFI